MRQMIGLLSRINLLRPVDQGGSRRLYGATSFHTRSGDADVDDVEFALSCLDCDQKGSNNIGFK